MKRSNISARAGLNLRNKLNLAYWSTTVLLEKGRLNRRLQKKIPRIALVKQDCNEDLYCCTTGLPAWETISSTLLRSGPVALFTFFETSFFLLRTETDPECNIWQEKADPLGWAPREWFESFRNQVPGRSFGQSQFAESPDQIDWSAFDVVISVDVSVPARITRQFPSVVWCYYVREIKAPSWQASLGAPIAGQDLFLSQRFTPRKARTNTHVVDFPYHFHHVGVFHDLVPNTPSVPDENLRTGVFVEYHSAREITDEQLLSLSAFGPVYAHRCTDDKYDQESGQRIPDCTMAYPALKALMTSKFHVKWSGRPALGTAKVEAIAAGCLCLTNPAVDGTHFLHSSASMINDFDDLMARLQSLEMDDVAYRNELSLQRFMVDFLCCYRPANDLLDACGYVLKSKLK